MENKDLTKRECDETPSPKKRIFMAHNSCLNSSYDLNLLKAGLEKERYEIVNQPELADEVIFSGCSVRDVWVNDAVNQINQIHSRAPGAKIIVTGCIANVSADVVVDRSTVRNLHFRSQSEILKDFTGLDFGKLDREVSQDNLQGYEAATDSGLSQLRQRIGALKAAVVASLQEIDREFNVDIEQQYRRTTKGFVFYNEVEKAELITVSRSCLYKCSFCNIPRGRGAFSSVPLADILAKAEAALARGVRHIILVGDEIGNYGMDDVEGRFADLMKALVELNSEVKISIRYIEPKPFLKNAEFLRRLCVSGNIELLYVSLQSGSQRILKDMNRNYDISKVASMYASFRNTTDTIFYCNWMVGFPGETDDDFQKTVDLVKTLDLQINVAIPFSARPGTPAEEFPNQISEELKAHRVTHLTDVIADLKVDMFRALLGFLSKERLEPLLQQIRTAEVEQYQEPHVRVRPITFHKFVNDEGENSREPGKGV